jgi:cell division protein FtsL
MIKLFHVVAIGALISSAAYAYTIKYETLYQTGQLSKINQKAQKEREAIAVLRAEWAHLNRPERLQVLADRHLDLKPLDITQVARFQDVPARGPKADRIGEKLEALGLNLDDAPVSSLPRMTPRPSAAASALPARPRPAAAPSSASRAPAATSATAPTRAATPAPPRPARQVAATPARPPARIEPARPAAPLTLRPPASIPAGRQP